MEISLSVKKLEIRQALEMYNCWAVNLCGICYATCYCENGLDISVKNNACDYHREHAKGELMAYYQLLEEKPEVIEKIKDIPII